ncbi:MAG TPA: ABC transporter permease [Vicinamibacterales bacterium]|nr:ABC transporter permease [Vicinamibacterales bacterium]
MTRTVRLLERAGRTLLRLAPASFRTAWEDEVAATVRAVCLDAHRERGWRGLIFAGMTELGSVGESALRLRLGRGPAIAPRGPQPPFDRQGKGARFMRLLINDLRLAFRSLASAKVVAAVAVLTLALGIGVNAAVFSILDSTIFRPVPFADADRYDEIWSHNPKGNFSFPRMAPGVFNEWRRQTDLYDRVEGYEITTFVHDATEGAEMITGAFVTPGLISMLRTPPLAGRVFADGDGRAGTNNLVLISEPLWLEEFVGDRDVIGKTISFNGRRHTVVGVMPASFRFPNGAARFWVPFDPQAPPTGPNEGPETLVTVGRRVAGASPEAVAAQVMERGAAIAKAGGNTNGYSAKVAPALHVDITMARSLYVLGGAVVFLLLIVCANLASLALSRSLARARDYAVRASLGASRSDLMRESIVEHLLIGVLGAGFGLLVARMVIELTLARLPESTLVRSMNAIDLDGRTLAFTMAMGLVTAILFGLPPAWFASKSGVAEMLKTQSRASTGSAGSRRIRNLLVVAEVTLAIVLLTGAALMARSFVKLQSVDRGFDTAGLAIIRIGLPGVGYADPRARDTFTDALIDQARKLPGVATVTAGSVPPDSSLLSFGEIEFADRPGEKTEELVLPVYQVWPNYFDVVGIPIKAGRPFQPGEVRTATIVSESFAKKYFGDGNAVGRQFRFAGAQTWRTIVGVAGEVRQMDLDDRHGAFEFYYPLMQAATANAAAAPDRIDPIVEYRSIVVRATDPGVTLDRLRQTAHAIDPRVVIWRADIVDWLFADAIARPRLLLLLMGVFAAMGLVLAAAGLYGVLSYLVAQRRREIGIRLALGARPASVGRLILGSGLRLTVAGIVLGTAAALGLVRVMQSLLYNVEPSDPVSVSGVLVVLLATAFAASWWPARRAMRVDPVSLLRED